VNAKEFLSFVETRRMIYNTRGLRVRKYVFRNHYIQPVLLLYCNQWPFRAKKLLSRVVSGVGSWSWAQKLRTVEAHLEKLSRFWFECGFEYGVCKYVWVFWFFRLLARICR